MSRADVAMSPAKWTGSDPGSTVTGVLLPIVSSNPLPLMTASVRSIPGNSENGPSEATVALLTRQSNVSSDARDGSAAISVVEPPPFFQGVVGQSLARMIFNAGPSSAQARQVELVRPRAIDGEVVGGMGVSHHAGGGIVPQHAADALGCLWCAITDNHHAGVLRKAHADAAAVVQRHPGRAARAIQKRIQKRPIRHRIRAVLHRFGFAVGGSDRAGIQVISAHHA